MPAYTHLQRAEPVLVGHWLLAYVEMFLRDADRLADCRQRLNVGPLGSGAIAGTTLPLDRRLMWDGFWTLANGRAWATLPGVLQDIVASRINEAALAERGDIRKLNETLRDNLVQKGMKLNFRSL